MNTDSNMVKQIKNPLKLIALFMFPGLLTVAGYALLTSSEFANSIPNIVLLGISAIAIMIPCELGIIYLYNKKQSIKVSYKNLTVYNKKLKFYNYLWIVPLLFAWSAFVMVSFKGIDNSIQNQFFSWIPQSFMLVEDISVLSNKQLIIVFLNSLLITGIAVPIVEEIYFRGFLLPRMEHLGLFAPILNAFLFSLYHLWSPWQFATRTIAIIPLCYVVYKTKNIKLSIITHCLLNILGDALGVLILIIK